MVVPPEHLEACRTCDANGLKCDMVKEGGAGIKDVDFVLYISAIATPQCGETIGNTFLLLELSCMWILKILKCTHGSLKDTKLGSANTRRNEIKFIHYSFFYSGNEADTVAYAAHCQQEASLDRPIAGHTNICPQAIVNGTKEIDALYSTIKHELLHALGFSSRYC